jgi:hypothetical protein
MLPNRTLGIVCGASDWPNLRQLDPADAFMNTASEFRDYITRTPGLGLPASNMLWLFDAIDSIAQYDQINDFLSRRLQSLESPTGRGVVIIFVYVGHANTFAEERNYSLLVRDTRAPIEGETSLSLSAIARIFRARAAESSRILILDCCFAGEAARYFQGGISYIVSTDDADSGPESKVPERGVALLCAASARTPARLEGVTSYTLFGHELVRVLLAGDEEIAHDLDLRRIGRLVRSALEGMEDAARPEVHSPDQTGGDLADVPLFPNFASKAEHAKLEVAEFREKLDLSEYIRVFNIGTDAHAIAPAAGVMALEASLGFQGRPIRLSARYVAEKTFELSGTRNGATFERVCQVLVEFGAPPEDAWPFRPEEYELPIGKGMEELDEEASQYRARVREVLTFKDLCESLAAGRPVVAGTPWYTEWFYQYPGYDPEGREPDGHIKLPGKGSSVAGSHGIVITTWDPDLDRIRFANNVGDQWGVLGFGWFNKEDAGTLVDSTAMWSIEAVDSRTGFTW